MRGIAGVMGNLVKEVTRTKVALAAYGTMEGAPKLENYAKMHAPWGDRSGNARKGLKGGCYAKGDKIMIYIAHQVDYGVYLELAHDCKYAILDPTIDALKGEIFNDYARIMRM
ncbi:hypothetical protein M0R72_18020 [Candidatus Pacearchaeota archaeon]|jgi:hypothetical protein|nr:hypothetical protein [Candidatus Pacearchaeota archaeon]